MVLTIRAAQSDTVQLPRTVGGRDAAPPEWSTWAEEPGHDLVALDGVRVVGGIHASLVGRTEAWLENLRVHPDFQGRGVAGLLVKEAEQEARRYGAAVVRTTIPAHDYAAQGVADHAGYRRVLRGVVVETDVPPGPLHMPYDAPVVAPEPAHASEVAGYLEQTTTVQAWDRLIPLGWRFRRLAVDLVKGLIKDRRLILALRTDSPTIDPGRAGPYGAASVFAIHDEAAVISLIDGTPPGMQAVYAAIVERAREQGASRLVAFTSDVSSLAPLGVRDWVPHPWCPDGQVVVEKSLAS